MVRFQSNLDGVAATHLQDFFVGWPDPPSDHTLLRILTGAYAVNLALDDQDQVIGFAYAVSDGVLAAYIPLLEVLPAHHGQGIGTSLIQGLLAQLEDLYMIDIVCDAALEAFYAPMGFVALTGMAKRNYARQNGAQKPT